MARRTAQQELEFQMQKMKDMGVTIRVNPARSRPDGLPDNHPFKIIADAATAAGINEDTKESTK